MAGTPASQLVGLCTGYGAVPSRIPKEAPFLRELRATRHAQEVLVSGQIIAWEYAAHELLICVTRPGGAAGFDERSARFARACLALDGSMSSYAQRMEDLANDPDFDYPTSRNTQTKLRSEAMGILAAKLVQLTEYPCGSPQKTESAIQEMLDLVGVVATRHLAHLNDEERVGVYREVFRRLVKAAAFFERHEPSMSLRERLETIVTAVAARPYRELYEQQMPNSIDRLIPPDEVWKLFEGRPSLFDPESAETVVTMRLIERMILDIEERGAWESVLLGTATADTGTLGQHEHAVEVVDDDDDLDIPDWLK